MDAVVWGLTISNINIYLVNTILASKYADINLFRLVSNSLIILIAIIPSLLIGVLLMQLGYILISVMAFWVLYIITAKILNLRALKESSLAIKKIISRK